MIKRVRYSPVLAGVAIGLLVSCSAQQKNEAVAQIHEGDRLTSFSQEISSSMSSLTLGVGETRVLDVTVKNTGTQPWFAHAAFGMVDASYRWVDGKGNVLPIEGNRASLVSAILKPGESNELKLGVAAPPSPGSYSLWVCMVQEGVDWFYVRGTKPLVIPANVR